MNESNRPKEQEMQVNNIDKMTVFIFFQWDGKELSDKQSYFIICMFVAFVYQKIQLNFRNNIYLFVNKILKENTSYQPSKQAYILTNSKAKKIKQCLFANSTPNRVNKAFIFSLEKTVIVKLRPSDIQIKRHDAKYFRNRSE